MCTTFKSQVSFELKRFHVYGRDIKRSPWHVLQTWIFSLKVFQREVWNQPPIELLNLRHIKDKTNGAIWLDTCDWNWTSNVSFCETAAEIKVTQFQQLQSNFSAFAIESFICNFWQSNGSQLKTQKRNSFSQKLTPLYLIFFHKEWD